MDTLLLRLQAPMQSWGCASHFSVRDTAREPTKSGVIGLICAALGRSRSADLQDLAELKMGVRVDREGKLMKDYHIAQKVYQAAGGQKASEPSNRYYLADAAFLAGLEGNLLTLEAIQNAVQFPRWGLFLGRKSFPPAKPVWLKNGLRKGEDLMTALTTFPVLAKNGEKLRLMLDDPEGHITCNDVPLSFEERQFISRRVSLKFIPAPEEELEKEWEDSHAAL